MQSKQRTKTIGTFQKFEHAVVAANGVQKALFVREMPSVMREMEFLEKTRYSIKALAYGNLAFVV